MAQHPDEASQIALVSRAAAGDTVAFQQLIEHYKGYVHTIVYQLLRNKEDAEEVTQDTFIKVYRSIRDFKGTSSFPTWLYRIAYNAALTRMRLAKLPFEKLEDESNYPHFQQDGQAWDGVRQEERARFIKLALTALSTGDRLVLTLYYLSECSLSEIGDITDCKPSVVKAQLHRARNRLVEQVRILLDGEARDLL